MTTGQYIVVLFFVGVLCLILFINLFQDLRKIYINEKIRNGKRIFSGKEIEIESSALVNGDVLEVCCSSNIGIYAYSREPFTLKLDNCEYISVVNPCGCYTFKQLRTSIKTIENPNRIPLKLVSETEIFVDIPARK